MGGTSGRRGVEVGGGPTVDVGWGESQGGGERGTEGERGGERKRGRARGGESRGGGGFRQWVVLGVVG